MVLQLLPPLYLYLCFRDDSYLYLLYMCLCFRDDGPQEGFGGVVLATRAATSALWPGGRRPLHPGAHPCHLDPAHCCSNQGEDTSFMFCLANGVSTVRICRGLKYLDFLLTPAIGCRGDWSGWCCRWRRRGRGRAGRRPSSKLQRRWTTLFISTDPPHQSQKQRQRARRRQSSRLIDKLKRKRIKN